MIRALLYLHASSWSNLLRLQARRLKRPKYLLGALAGAVYFSSFLLMLGPGKGLAAHRLIPEVWMIFELIGAVCLVLYVVADWLFPTDRASLNFSEEEVAFLFPAPVTRRALIHYKLVKSQVGVGFSALLLGLFSGRYAGEGRIWMHMLGWWLVMSTLHLHQLGASFARTLLLDRGRTHAERRVVGSAIVVVGGGLLLWWSWGSLPVLVTDPPPGFVAVGNFAQAVLFSQPLGWVLLPFRLVLGPMLAPSWPVFFQALLPALGILVVHYIWVIRSNASFEEATIEAARRRAQTAAAMRSGNWHMAQQKRRSMRAPFGLRPAGTPTMALLWKNMIAADSGLNIGGWAVVGLGYFLVAMGFRSFSPGSVWAGIMGVVPMAFGPCVLLFGPGMMRFDLRQDLRAADLLKTYPLPGWRLVLGELLAPALVLTLAESVFAMLWIVLFPESHRGIPLDRRLALGVSAMILAPLMNMFALLPLNGAALLYPAWGRSGPGGGQGMEAIGQQMILMVGQVLALALALILPAGPFALVYFLGRHWMSLLLLLPLASAAAAVVLAVEVFLGIRMLGDLFDRLDISDEMLA